MTDSEQPENEGDEPGDDGGNEAADEAIELGGDSAGAGASGAEAVKDNAKIDVKRTRLAQEGLDVATLFTAKYMHMNLNGYVPKMREPTGVSTEGGKQATQHILLEPKIAGEPVITIGQANLVTKTAKLRTFDCLDTMHSMRFQNKPFALSQPVYQKFFDELREFFRKYQLNVEIEMRPPEMKSVPPRGAARSAQSSGSAGWIGFLLLVVVSGVLIWLVATGRLHLPRLNRRD